jgi:predicted PurR-regulated permease PerM
MYADFYHKKEKTVDITFPKLLVVMITVMIFFVFPAQIITAYRSQPEIFSDAVAEMRETLPFLNEKQDTGQVAGASTSSAIQQVNASTGETSNGGGTESTSFAVLGVFFLSVSIVAIWYLKQTEKNYKIIS